MAQKTQQAATAVQLKQVRERIERWRGSRRRCSPMPARLWDEATALARELGVYPVKRALGLNYESLKRRVGSGRPGRGRAEADASGFVELSGAQLLGLPVATGPMIEVSDGNGVRLTAAACVFRRAPSPPAATSASDKLCTEEGPWPCSTSCCLCKRGR